jgi:DNA repair exonuclease SbcCD nuclease subunit
MKWAITADPQFDDQPSYSTILPSGLTSRLVDYIDCFDWVVDTARERDCEGLIVLGDIFDSRTSISLSVIDQVCRAFKRASQDLDVHVLVGNHDCQMRVPTVNSLQAFLGTCTVHEKPTTVGKFAFMPWVESVTTFRDEVAHLAKDCTAEYLLSHILISDALPNANVGRSVQDLMPDRWKQVLLGDVHQPVRMLSNVRYCGAPMQIHYGDAGGERGFYILDDETGELEFIKNTYSPKFHIVDENTPIERLCENGDFCRIQTSDPEVAKRIAIKLREKAEWVETTAVELVDDTPRLQLHTSNTQEDTIKKYLVFKGLDGVDGLLELALEIIGEVGR